MTGDGAIIGTSARGKGGENPRRVEVGPANCGGAIGGGGAAAIVGIAPATGSSKSCGSAAVA
jgi:hypothetical protein